MFIMEFDSEIDGKGFLRSYDVIAKMVYCCSIPLQPVIQGTKKSRKNDAKELEKKENQLRKTSKDFKL